MQKCLLYQNILIIFNFIHLKKFLSIRYTENVYIFACMLYFASIYALKYLLNDLEYFLLNP